MSIMETFHMPKEERDSGELLAAKINELVELGEMNDSVMQFIFTNLERIRKSLIPKQKCICSACINLPPEFSVIPPLMLQNRSLQTKPTHALSAEKERIEKRLQGFQYKNSNAWKTLIQLYGETVKRSTLCEIAKFISSAKQLKIDRDAKRRKDVLVKWFEDNWSDVYPFIKYVRVKNEIPFFSQNEITV